MRSLLAGWRVSLRRTRADWPIVAAAFLITLLAAVLLAAGAIYPSAAAEAGLRRALTDAPIANTNIEVSLYGAAADAAAIEAKVQPELAGVLSFSGGGIVRDWRSSETLALPALPAAKAGDQAILGYLDGLPDHAALVDGAWPADAGPSGQIEVVVVDDAASALGLHVGDVLALVAHPSEHPVAVPVRLVGTFSVGASDDPYWNGEDQLFAGLHENGSYRTFGPFLTTRTDLLRQAGVADVHLQWRAFPNFDQLAVDDATQFRARVEVLEERLQIATGKDVFVATGLPDILRAAERSLLVSRTGVLLLMAQLAILAAYAVVLTASLLVDHRRVDTALLRSRGAGAPQIAALALAEGALLAAPAVLVAPWLAVGALSLLNVAGPLADVGLRIVPRVTGDGYVAAGAAGLACVALLVLPAALAARGFAAEQGGLSRQETRTFGQRMGLDVALLAVTGIALWQLRLYGAPLTRTVQGTLGLDPLLVAAPAIGLIAGGVLALRILPLLAQAMEWALSRGRDLMASLGSRQLARRPLRYTRSALLLMLAVSMGVFALSYAATWSGSQRDQAAYQAGADIRIAPSRKAGGLATSALPGAYAKLAGVTASSPVERVTDGITFAAAGSADFLSLDADSAAGIVLLRADEAPSSLAEMFGALRAGRPGPRMATLPPGATSLRVVPDVVLKSYVENDFNTGEQHLVPIEPALLAAVRVNASVIIRDGHGLLYRVASDTGSRVGPTDPIVLPLPLLDAPVELAGLAISVWIPGFGTVADGVVGVATLSAGNDPAGPWTDVPLAAVGAWSATSAHGLDVPTEIPVNLVRGTTVRLSDQGGPETVLFTGEGGAGTQFNFIPSSVATAAGSVPVIANRAFLEAAASAPREPIAATVEGRLQTLSVVGVVDSFPTTDPERPLAILDGRTLGLLRLQGAGGTRNPDEWWLAAPGGDASALTRALRAAPFSSASVVSAVDRARSLSADPVALGIIGALALGFVATGLFAIVGLTVSAAVSARQRRTEFALLRALGLSGRQLAGSLWLENGTIVAVSLLAGTGLGLLIAWVVLPFVTVTQAAAAPLPPVLVDVPWERIVLLDVVSAMALGIAVVAIGAVLRRIGVGSILRMGED